MLTQLLALVILVGLTATTLLLCLEKWGVLAAWEVHRPEWLMKRCDMCAGYWICVTLLLAVAGVAIGCHVLLVDLGGLILMMWGVLLLALPAAAISRVLFGLSAGR